MRRPVGDELQRGVDHAGGGGGPVLRNSWILSLIASALSAIVMPTMTNGASTVTAISSTISSAAMPERPLSRLRRWMNSGHSVAQRISAQMIAVRKGDSTRKQPISSKASTTIASVRSIWVADFMFVVSRP